METRGRVDGDIPGRAGTLARSSGSSAAVAPCPEGAAALSSLEPPAAPTMETHVSSPGMHSRLPPIRNDCWVAFFKPSYCGFKRAVEANKCKRDLVVSRVRRAAPRKQLECDAELSVPPFELCSLRGGGNDHPLQVLKLPSGVVHVTE